MACSSSFRGLHKPFRSRGRTSLSSSSIPSLDRTPLEKGPPPLHSALCQPIGGQLSLYKELSIRININKKYQVLNIKYCVKVQGNTYEFTYHSPQFHCPMACLDFRGC